MIGWIWVVTVDGRKGNRTSITRQRYEAPTFSQKNMGSKLAWNRQAAIWNFQNIFKSIAGNNIKMESISAIPDAVHARWARMFVIVRALLTISSPFPQLLFSIILPTALAFFTWWNKKREVKLITHFWPFDKNGRHYESSQTKSEEPSIALSCYFSRARHTFQLESGYCCFTGLYSTIYINYIANLDRDNGIVQGVLQLGRQM
jgi:hypothetical protein